MGAPTLKVTSTLGFSKSVVRRSALAATATFMQMEALSLSSLAFSATNHMEALVGERAFHRSLYRRRAAAHVQPLDPLRVSAGGRGSSIQPSRFPSSKDRAIITRWLNTQRQVSGSRVAADTVVVRPRLHLWLRPVQSKKAWSPKLTIVAGCPKNATAQRGPYCAPWRPTLPLEKTYRSI